MDSQKITIKDVLALFKKIPFMIEEFEEISTNKYGEGDTSSMLSPLLEEAYMDTEEISEVVDVAVSVLPYYIYATTNYSEIRDPAYLDVPSALQNDFWSTWFRDSQGTEFNSLINSIHNKLKYNFLSEEHILNRNLFKKLLSFDENTINLTLQDEENDEITLDTVISEKLISSYKLLNYVPPQSKLIDDWMDSLYKSGRINYQEKLQEENLFKIQDLKSELLRRKFAGSASLYKILVSSINRKGTFAPTMPLSAVTGEGGFDNDRYIRALNMPGITTVAGDSSIDPLTVFKEKIPARTIYPLYYTSEGYDADDFEINPTAYLRSNKAVFAWDDLQGIFDSSLIIKKYPRMDSLDTNSTTDYGQLDQDPILRLDEATPLLDLSTITGSFFDIQADSVLFHENTLQEATGQNYPFVTYSIASGNSLSTMDTSWLDFVDTALDKKTKIQDQVDIGVQVSKFLNYDSNVATENFVIITFSENFISDFNAQDSAYDSTKHRYSYLWNMEIRYDINTYASEENVKLITYNLLKVDMSGVSDEDKLIVSSHPSYNTFTTSTSGLFPFSYQDISESEIFDMELFLGKREGSEEYSIVDDVYSEGYSKAWFLFTSNENTVIAKDYYNKNPDILVEEYDGTKPVWSWTPKDNKSLKHVIYGTKRYNEDTGSYNYLWSEPLRVYPKETYYELKDYHPDWMGLVGYYNPYLNVVSNSSSSLRGEDALYRGLKPLTEDSAAEEINSISVLSGPSENSALMNINLKRQREIYCNQTGEDTSLLGTYLHREVQIVDTSEESFDWDQYVLGETLEIWGDNRPGVWDEEYYVKDPADDWDSSYVRSQWFTDDYGVYALKQSRGFSFETGIKHNTYFDMRPQKDDSDTSGWNQWVWNRTDTNGMTFCIDFMLDETPSAEIPEDYYLASRRGKDDTKTVNAEFDFYLDRSTFSENIGTAEEPEYTIIPRLVYKVYPEGNKSGITFECALNDLEFIESAQQVQVACSYKYELTSHEGNPRLNTTQTVTADRAWNTIYRVIVDDGVNYNIYIADDDSFDINGKEVVQSIPSSFNPYTSGDAFTGFFFGQLIKDNNEDNSSLEGINIANRDYGFNPLIGYIYDVRLFNRGMSKWETVIVSSGSRRELYSYSPSIFKLIYSHYNNMGIIRRHIPAPADKPSVDKIRVFSRGTWDSVLNDMYPVSREEIFEGELQDPDYFDPKDDRNIYDAQGDFLEGVVEQKLVRYYETDYGISFEAGSDLYYNKEKIDLGASGTYSYVQTTLYPVDYSKKYFESGVKLIKDEENSSTEEHYYKAYLDDETSLRMPEGASLIEIPSSPAGDSLTYKADLDLNFTLPHRFDLGAPLVKGTKIRTSGRGNRMYAVHDTSANDNITTQNLLVVPFNIPDQTTSLQLEAVWSPELYKIDLEEAVLSPYIKRLLNSSTYYNEIQTPIPFKNISGEYEYTSRWNAVRALKEGEYYITCKYPLQILPFDNVSTSSNANYPVFYASVRFKVVVQGNPLHYVENIEGLPGKWNATNLEATMKDAAFKSEDNRTYPHRQINIDLYVMEDEDLLLDRWSWKKIASNYDSSVQIINRNALEESLILEEKIPAIFTATYKTPFFDKEGNVDRITMRVTPNEEKLNGLSLPSTRTESSYTMIKLKMGKSYELLFDYTASVSEFAYSKNIYPIDSYITAEEYNQYNHSVNLLDSGDIMSKNMSKVLYNSNWDWTDRAKKDMDLYFKSSGYYVNDSNMFAGINQEYTLNDLSLGDPYCESLNKNLLIGKYPDKRNSIYNLGFFPYRVENKDILVPPRYFGEAPIPAIEKYNGNIMIKPLYLDEYSIVKNYHNKCVTNVLTLINKLKNGADGLFSGLGRAAADREGSVLYTTSEDITEKSHTFVSYKVAATTLNIVNDVMVNIDRPYGNNILATEDFNDAGYYSKIGTYTYDADLNRDVYDIVLNGDVVNFSYYGNIPPTALISVLAKSDVALNMGIKLTNSKTKEEVIIDAQELATSWQRKDYDWTGDSTSSIMTLVITPLSGSFSNNHLYLDGLEARVSVSENHQMSLSEAYSNSSTTTGNIKPALPAFKTVCFKRKSTGGYFPLQVLNDMSYISREEATSFISSFLSNNEMFITSEKQEVELFKPWKTRMSFRQSAPEASRLYNIRLKQTGNANKKVEEASSISSKGGIFEIYGDSLNFKYPDQLEITGEKGLVFRPDKFKKQYKFDIEIDDSVPFIFADENFSMVSNCFNYSKYIKGVSSPVAITNIQFLNEDSAILYELEYFPIIYDELRHHFSLNLLLKD